MLKLIREQLITRLDHTYRFNGTPLIPPAESVSQHSYWVTVYSNLIFRDLFFLAFERHQLPVYFEMYNFLIRQALFHDMGEQITGDVLWDVKHVSIEGATIRACLNNVIEDQVNNMKSDNIFVEEWKSVLWQDRLPGQFHTVLNYVTDLTEIQKLICLGINKLSDWISCYHFSYNQYCLGNKLMVEKCEIAIVEMRKVLIGLASALETSKLPYSCSSLEQIIN